MNKNKKVYSIAYILKSFLQDVSSNLFIERKGALQQHCLAAVTCLLSSFRLLDGTCDNKYQSIVKGLYEFQVYASEYWADCLLDEAGDQDGLHPDSLLYHLVTQLSSRLEGILSPLKGPEEPFDLNTEPRLSHFQRYPLISKHVQRSLQARSLAGLEGRLKQQDGQLKFDSGFIILLSFNLIMMNRQRIEKGS